MSRANIFKLFRFQVVFRILLICLTIFIFFFLIFKTKLYASNFILIIILIYQVYSLIRFHEKSNRDLSRFLQAIRYADFSQSFSYENQGKAFKDLYREFSEIINNFQHYRTDKEEHFRYLQTIVQHIGIGLIVFQLDGTVDLTNTAAKRLLKFTELKNIKALKILGSELVETLFNLKSGEKSLLKIEDAVEPLQLAIYATEFRMRGKIFKLVSLQNIGKELEEKEMEAWQKMIRILTHEIMNSVTPISSLTSTVIDMLDPLYNTPDFSQKNSIEVEALEDIHQAVKTIHKRSQGLIHFISAYRNLALIPKPKFQIFPVSELFRRIEKLMESKFSKSNIEFTSNIEPESLELTADPELIEQVLINLTLNSIEAVRERRNPRISLIAKMDKKGEIEILVTDNGPGISGEASEKIFIPFFTTKKKGSGIGLSISRLIMRLHGGTIRFHSQPDKKTTFILRF